MNPIGPIWARAIVKLHSVTVIGKRHSVTVIVKLHSVTVIAKLHSVIVIVKLHSVTVIVKLMLLDVYKNIYISLCIIILYHYIISHSVVSYFIL